MYQGRRKRPRDAAPPRPAYDKALDLLARREHSQHELRTRLLRDGYARDAIDDALTRLGEAGYQDDARFAAMLVRSRIRQGYGPQRLRAELKSHGLTNDAIGNALEAAAADIDWAALAQAQLHHRYGGSCARDYAERARRTQYLMRRGFDGAIARTATQADDDAS